MGVKLHNKLTVAVFVLAVVVYGCSDRPRGVSQSEADRLRCQRQIRCAAYCVLQYLAEHDGQFPRTLEEAVSGEAGEQMAQRLTQCPVKGAAAKYIYVDWSRWFTNGAVPKDYPLIYESKRNLHGDGINVALRDGSVFWDEGARWITDFGKTHPDYRLEIPQYLSCTSGVRNANHSGSR